MLPRALLMLVVQFEDKITQAILRRPGFHRFVGRIHRFVDEKQHGPRPGDSPLRQGEASEEPGREGFFAHFTRELRNQARGKPSKEGGKDVTKR